MLVKSSVGPRRLAAFLLLAALAVLSPSLFSSGNKAADTLPPELALVPEDAFGFVYLRAGEVWDHPAIVKLRQILPKEFEQKFTMSGFDPADIDSVTFVATNVYSLEATLGMRTPPKSKAADPFPRDIKKEPFPPKEKPIKEPEIKIEPPEVLKKGKSFDFDGPSSAELKRENKAQFQFKVKHGTVTAVDIVPKNLGVKVDKLGDHGVKVQIDDADRAAASYVIVISGMGEDGRSSVLFANVRITGPLKDAGKDEDTKTEPKKKNPPTDGSEVGVPPLGGLWSPNRLKAELQLPTSKSDGFIATEQPPPGASDEMMLIFTMKKPVDRQKMTWFVGPGAVEAKHKDKTYFTGNGFSIHFVNDHTFVVTEPVNLMKKILERPEQVRAAGPLAAALNQAAKKQQLVVGLNLTEPSWLDVKKKFLASIKREQGRHGPESPFVEFASLLDARSACLAVSLVKDHKVQLQAGLTFASSQRAATALGQVQDGLVVGRVFTLGQFIQMAQAAANEHVEDGRFPTRPDIYLMLGLARQVEAALRGAVVDRREATVRIQAEGEFDIDYLRGKARIAADNFVPGPTYGRRWSMNNLKQLTLALHTLHDQNRGQLPPAAICSPRDGKPLLSWRVLVLPFIEEHRLYEEFKLDEPWDSPHNIKLLPKMPKIYAPVGVKTKDPHATFLQVFVGKGTPLNYIPDKNAPYGARTQYNLGNIPNGTSNTIGIVEAGQAVPWTKPAELEYDAQKPLPKLGGRVPGRIQASMLDGSVRTLILGGDGISEQELRRMITCDSGKGNGWRVVEKPLEPPPVVVEKKKPVEPPPDKEKKTELALDGDSTADLAKEKGAKHTFKFKGTVTKAEVDPADKGVDADNKGTVWVADAARADGKYRITFSGKGTDDKEKRIEATVTVKKPAEPPPDKEKKPVDPPEVEKKKPAEPLPAELVAAWEKAGAHDFWMEGPTGTVPAFGFDKWQEGVIGKLPQPEGPFGLSFHGTALTDAGLKELAALKSLQALSLFETKVTNAGLKQLAPLKSLRVLNLAETKVTSAGLKDLAALSSLQDLTLSGQGVTDAGLADLAALSSLRILNLGGSSVTGAGLRDLTGLKSLQELSLFSARVSDAGLKGLAGLTSLRKLNLAGNRVTEVGLKELAALKSLEQIDLSFSGVTDLAVKELSGLTSLRSLELAYTRVTGSCLKDLTSLKSLQKLDLSYTKMSQEGLKGLAALNSLQVLGLAETEFPEGGLRHLVQLESVRSVRELRLGGKNLTDGDLKELAALKSLQSLGLENAPVTDAGLKQLAQIDSMKLLRKLSLRETKVTDLGLTELASCKSLKTLNLNDTKVTDAGMKELATLTSLEELDLGGTILTDAGLKKLAGLKSLKELVVFGTKITRSGAAALEKEIPGLRIVGVPSEVVPDRDALPADIITAWTKSGAKSGWMNLKFIGAADSMRYEREGLPPEQGEVPGFTFDQLEPGTLKALAVPERPFGLRLSGIATDGDLADVARFKTLQILMFSFSKVTDAGLKELSKLESLRSLKLYRTKVTDAGLKELAGMKSMRTLGLGTTEVTDAGLKELAGMKSLRDLDLGRTKVTGVGLKELAGLKSLQLLDLSEARVTDAGLKEVANLTSLRWLNLAGNQVSDVGVKELAGLKSLQELDLNLTKVTGVGLKDLAGLESFHSLKLNGADVTDEGLKALAGLKSLTKLEIAGTRITDAGLKELAALTTLEELSLIETKVSDTGLKGLAGLKSLRQLSVSNTQVTPAGAMALQKAVPGLSVYGAREPEKKKPVEPPPEVKQKTVNPLPAELVKSWEMAGARAGWFGPTEAGGEPEFRFGGEGREGDVPAFSFRDWKPGRMARLPQPAASFALLLNFTTVTDGGLGELAGCTFLHTLDLRGTQVKGAGLKDLAEIKSLRVLYLSGTKLTDRGMKELPGLTSLRKLYLNETQITDAGLKELAGMESLRFLSLYNTKVTDAGLKELAAVTSLHALVLGVTKVTDAGLKELGELKSLQTLNLAFTKVTDDGLKELAGMTSLRQLYLNQTPITDAGLKELAGLKSLQLLHLGDTPVTDTGLKELAGLKSLQYLSLHNTKVTNAGLKELAGLKSLQTLLLNGTQVTDAGLKELIGLTSLRTLVLQNTNVTEAGMAEMREAMPDLKNLVR